MFPACPLSMPISCTDSCRQTSCVCCSSNVSVRNWEKRTVRYNEADNELHDEPTVGTFLKFLQKLCCCGKPEVERERRESACQAVNIFLIDNYQVDLTEAANACRLPIAPYQRGERRIKVGDFQSLKLSAAEICKRRSGPSGSESSGSDTTPSECFSIPRRGMHRQQATIWRKPEQEETTV